MPSRQDLQGALGSGHQEWIKIRGQPLVQCFLSTVYVNNFTSDGDLMSDDERVEDGVNQVAQDVLK